MLMLIPQFYISPYLFVFRLCKALYAIEPCINDIEKIGQTLKIIRFAPTARIPRKIQSSSSGSITG